MRRKFFLILILLITALFASACSGGRLAATSWPGVTFADETVFVSFGPHVYALDPTNGNLKWQFPVETERNVSFFAAPVPAGEGQLIIGGYDNVLYSLNPETGQANSWSFSEAHNRFIASPLATENGIFAPSADGNMYALDFQGNALWQPFETPEAQWASPSTDGKTIYLPSLDHNLYAINAQNGQKVWNTDLGGAIVSSPTVGEDGIVYAGTFGNSLQALNTQNGKLRWMFETSDWVWASPALNGDTLYFGDIAGTFYALDAADGTSRWQFTADAGIFGTPLVTEEAIYIATEAGTLYAFDDQGQQLWSRPFEGKIYTSPVPADNLIILSTLETESLIIAVDRDGNTRWSFTPDNG